MKSFQIIGFSLKNLTKYSLIKQRFFKKSINSFYEFSEKTTPKAKIYQEDDLVFDIGNPEKFRGMLIICPTPIGNLNDISIRQYEAIKSADILACEDTRITGKLIDLINRKKMRENFLIEFGISIDDFVNAGGLDMSDELIEEKFLKNKNSKCKESINSSQIMENNKNDRFNCNEEKDSEIQRKMKATNYYEFYYNEEDIVKKEFINNNVLNLNSRDRQVLLNKYKQKIDLNEDEKKSSITNIEQKIFNKFNVKDDTFNQIKNKSDYHLKKQKLFDEENDEEIENLAETYSKCNNLSYILKAKARYIINSTSNKFQNKAFTKFYDSIRKDDESEEDHEYLDVEYGLEDNYFIKFKQKIKDEKIKKGRGILFRYKDEIKEKSTKTLIRAMKLGLKVVLLSDAGTPTISDPGYKLVCNCIKEKINVESIPGPCALITALSTSGLPTDKFIFLGYIPKGIQNKIEYLERLKEMGVTGVMYESPLRIIESVDAIINVFGCKQKIYIANELTKINEKHFYGSAKEILDKLTELNQLETTFVRGEITIVVSPFHKDEESILSREELRTLGYKTDINIVEVAKKLDKLIKLNHKELKQILVEVLNVPKVRAQKLVTLLKNQTNKQI